MSKIVPLLLLLCHIAVRVKAGTWMRKHLRRTSETNELPRPTIHTFICEDESMPNENEFVLEWAEVWSNTGWEPVVLTEKDAKDHPKYELYKRHLKDLKVPPIRWCRYMRYLAMSMQEDGGWYADISIIPIVQSDDFYKKGYSLPNEGHFTMHDDRYIYLLSGNKEAWEIFSSQIINNLAIKNDSVMLSLLAHNNPGKYFTYDSVVHLNDILYSNLKPITDCTNLDNRLAVSVLDVPVGERTKSVYYNAIQAALETCKPAIYTFLEMAYTDENYQKTVLTDLEEWKRAWSRAGWKPVVLNVKDAKKHPIYNEFQGVIDSGANKESEYDKMCFYRWLAVAAAGGGYMADIDTYPLHMDPAIYGQNLPYNGRFTSSCWAAPCLVSGSEAEWNRVIPMMLESLRRNNEIKWSDMFAMQEVINNGEIIMKRSVGK